MTPIHWADYAPADHDVQVSARADMLACGPFSLVHCIEMWLKYKTGYFWEWSERGLAAFSGVNKEIGGTSEKNVVDAINDHGLLLTADWPELLYSTNYADVTWQQFYAPVPHAIQQKAYRFFVQAQKIAPRDAANALYFAPLWTIIDVGKTFHFVAQMSTGDGRFGLGTYYDSYELTFKDFQPSQPIVSQYQLTIIPKNMPNSYLIQVNKKDGTKEIAVALPATSEVALIDKCLNTGLPIPTLNNGQNVDFPNLPIRYTVNE